MNPDYKVIKTLVKNEIIKTVEIDPNPKIKITENHYKVIKEIGITGSYNKKLNLINIDINPSHKNIQRNLKTELARAIAHEYAHCIREQKFRWENCTLIEALICEGIAQWFEMEIIKSRKPAIYSKCLNYQYLRKYWLQLKPLLNTKKYDYNSWFYGDKDKKLPKWIGYAIGFWLVEKYMKKFKKVPHELLFTPPKKFIF